MTLGGCTSPRQSMDPAEAVAMVTDRVRKYVDFSADPEIIGALNTIHLAINENENLRIDLAEAQRLCRDLYMQLDQKRQVVFA